MGRMGRFVLVLGFLFAAGLSLSCDGCEDAQTVVESTGDSGNTDLPFATNDAGQVICKNGEPCACSDGADNDNDGLVDGFDPECTGPYDDDEATFATGIPGDNRDPKWQDCFFDGNSGAGDDGCRYHTDCLTGVKLPDDPDCTLTQECIDFCRPRTPNGCDCLDCCEVNTPQGLEWVVIGGECSTDSIEDCVSCTPTDSCQNGCGTCEICIGQTEDDLPESCFESDDMGNGGPTCDDGETRCDVDADCENQHYCQFGCCLYAPN